MAIQRYAGDKLVGLSGDSKPLNIADGATFYESDTLKIFLKKAGSWEQVTGYSGYSGFSGISGYSGASGISGYSGASGVSGYSGVSGISGYSGDSGISGYSGFSGVSGYSGASGISGYSGESGASGYSGASGISGYSGASGISGYSGASGISGYSGDSGISGYSSFSGYSGISGFSGYSGVSGTPGALEGITYFTNDNASGDIGGFNSMIRMPDADPEVQYSAVGDGSGVLIKQFVTDLYDPNVTIVDNGVWRNNVYAYIDSSGGTNTVRVDVIKRAVGGAETPLFSFETDDITGIGLANVSMYETLSAQDDIPLLVTDRLEFKYYAKSTTGKTVSICVGGSAHYSHVHTPLVTQGYSGYSGFSGISGYSGASGISGYSGASGISGYSGASGISGYSGASGVSGYSGDSGVSGYSGASGISGYSGASGYSGESGISGYSGASGISGYSGASGISGYSGDSGISGYSGASGVSGYSGESGISGYSGDSGYSGVSGAGVQYWDRNVGLTYLTPTNSGDKIYITVSDIEVAGAPLTPASDHIRVYAVASGISPSRVVKYCIKDETGIETIILSVIV